MLFLCGFARADTQVSCEDARTIGAKGDGSADDTAALQAAIDQALISRIYVVCLAPGKYVINRPLTAVSKSLAGTYLTLTGASSMWAYNDPANATVIVQGPAWKDRPEGNALLDLLGASQVRVANLGLQCAKPMADGLELGDAKFARVEQVSVYGCNRGIYAQHGGLGFFSDNQVTRCNYGIELNAYGDSQLSGNYVNTNQPFHKPTAYNDLTGTGIYLTTGSGNVNIIGGKVEWNARGIVVYASQGVNVSSVQFDSNMAGHIFVYADYPTAGGTYNARSITITGNRFLGGGQNDASGGTSGSGSAAYRRAAILIDARLSTRVSAVISGNSFRAGARCAYDNNAGTDCGDSGPADAAIYANAFQGGNTNVIVTGNDLMDASSHYTVVASGSGTTVKLTGNLINLPNAAVDGATIETK